MKKTITISILGLIILAFILYKKFYNNKKELEKVLYLETPCMPSTLDPTLVTDDYGFIELSKVYEGLLEYHYLKRPAELIPNLAESMPEISRDGMVYTFKVKKGVFFQDNKCFPNGKGRELTAQDFVYAFMRFADPKLQSPLYSMINGRIKGLSEWRAKYKDSDCANYADSIAGLEAVDKYTIRFTLTRPWPQFLHILTMPYAFAIPAEAVSYYKTEFLNNPVGTGPFVIKSFNPQENKIIAYKNHTFREKRYPSEASPECAHFLEDAGKLLPFLDRIETYVITEEQPKWLQFISKKLDIIDLGGISDLNKKIDGDEPIAEFRDAGILFMLQPCNATSMIVMNNTVYPFKGNSYLRKAISMAYDRNKANELFNDNLSIIAQSLIPPGLPGYEKNFVNQNNLYNLEEAKQLMIKAGYPDGKGLGPITLDIVESTRSRQGAEFFKNCMEKIGIKINISSNSWPELCNKMSKHTTQMHTSGWIAAYPDAENLFIFFYSKNEKKISFGEYTNSEYDNLYDYATALPESPERTKYYEKMNRFLAEDVPALFITHGTNRQFYYSWVRNFQYFDAKRHNLVQYLDIDMDKKNKIMSTK